MTEIDKHLAIHDGLLTATARYLQGEGEAPDEDEVRDALQEFLYDLWKRAAHALDEEDITDAERWKYIENRVIVINMLQDALAQLDE